MTVPPTARRKVLRPREWYGDQPTTVYLDPVARKYTDKRKFNVYAEDGTPLGFIEEYHGTIDTQIPGTRLRRQGKRRTFWAANGTDYWRNYPSQADAIRQLRLDHDNKENP